MSLGTKSDWHRFIKEKARKPRTKTSPRKLYDFEDLVEDLMVENETEEYKKSMRGIQSASEESV